MEIVRVDNSQAFADLARPWTRLIAECPAATVNSTYEWARVWWDHFAGDREMCILAAVANDEVLGIAPLAIATSPAVRGLANRRTIGFLGEGTSDYGDFIIPLRHGEVISAFVRYLRTGGPAWDRIALREIPEDSPSLPALAAAAREVGLECLTRDSTSCLRVELPADWDEYYGRVRAKFRSDLRRRLANLEDIGPVSLVRHGTADDALWNELLQVNEQHLAQKSKQDLGRDIAFLRDLGEVMGTSGMLDISVLKVGPAIAAFNIGLRFRDVVYHWRVGFEPEWHKYAPGRLLIRFLLEDCISSGTTCLDFMRGTEEYKRAWVCEERRNLNVTIESSRLGSRMRALLRRLVSAQG